MYRKETKKYNLIHLCIEPLSGVALTDETVQLERIYCRKCHLQEREKAAFVQG